MTASKSSTVSNSQLAIVSYSVLPSIASSEEVTEFLPNRTTMFIQAEPAVPSIFLAGSNEESRTARIAVINKQRRTLTLYVRLISKGTPHTPSRINLGGNYNRAPATPSGSNRRFVDILLQRIGIKRRICFYTSVWSFKYVLLSTVNIPTYSSSSILP